MNTSSRRNFLKALGGATALASFPTILKAATTGPRVIVVGGGFGGATAAKYLKHWSPDLNVTLIEPKAKYQSPIMSNLVLNGQLSMDQITFSYDALAQKYGVEVITDWVSGVDGVTQKVSLSSGAVLEYDRLILAPGITFNPVEGHDLDKVPHAWQSGEQVTMLQQQLEAMPAGGTFVMSIPAAPYRCPPGPYERACVIADYLKSNKPGSKVIVLDANADILVEKEIFGHAFDTTYAGIVEYHKEVVITGVDSDQLVVSTESMSDIKADVLNIIPEQSAGEIIKSAGLITVADRWAGVNPLSYESTMVNNIHVIGDSQGTGQPKAGHIANSEAKVCADAVIRLLNGGLPYAAPMTNSACYSPVSADTATWLTAVYGYDSATDSIQKVAGSGGSASTATKNNYEEMFVWSKSLFGDTFS
ncbi:FAD-dependent oxidoreductase [uncultured Cocleimonas sp.]|uniref:FAD-dependent oxidoreductase n=1 Tax=uncultured Cocleimonas sp. TaxID=1051587 RepID=UPI002610D8A4|nr:FAD-dependent oxidoreductase [uncultured Cocleimonas sp.]